MTETIGEPLNSVLRATHTQLTNDINSKNKSHLKIFFCEIQFEAAKCLHMFREEQ